MADEEMDGDDFIFAARVGELEDVTAYVSEYSSTPERLVVANEGGSTALHMAAANGHTDVLRVILQPLPDETRQELLSRRNASGNTAAHWAAMNGQLDAVKLLVEAGADTSLQNEAGRTVTAEADAHGKQAVCEWLLDFFIAREPPEGPQGGEETDERVDDADE